MAIARIKKPAVLVLISNKPGRFIKKIELILKRQPACGQVSLPTDGPGYQLP